MMSRTTVGTDGGGKSIRRDLLHCFVCAVGVGMTRMTIQKMKTAIAVAVGVVTTTRTTTTMTGGAVDGETTKRDRLVDRPEFTLATSLIQ